MRIAITSTDGKSVNEHFGRTGRFLIYDGLSVRRRLIAVREVEPLSTGDKNHPFDPERMAGIIHALRDCRLVCCKKNRGPSSTGTGKIRHGGHCRHQADQFDIRGMIPCLDRREASFLGDAHLVLSPGGSAHEAPDDVVYPSSGPATHCVPCASRSL